MLIPVEPVWLARQGLGQGFRKSLEDFARKLPVEPSHASVWNIIQKLSFDVESAPLTPALKHYRYVFKLQLGLAGRRHLPPSVSADSRLRPNLTSRTRWNQPCRPPSQPCQPSREILAQVHGYERINSMIHKACSTIFHGPCRCAISEDWTF